ncbi:MAG: cell envelope integrity protein CreD [Burkholderiales bacterium]|nr:cell envelope integrity protein CreD [Burkholderiales bacterium]
MQKSLIHKFLIVGVLTVLIGIPLMMIQFTIAERMAFRAEAVRTISADSVREQTVVGPVLVIPYVEEYEREEAVQGETLKTRIEKHAVPHRLLVYPNDLQISGGIDTDNRYRGIHKVLIYSGQYQVAGDFTLPALADFQRTKPDSRLTLDKPFVALSISDVRGIRNIPRIDWNGQQIEFEQGSKLTSFKDGLHANVDITDWKQPANVKFSFGLELDGIERLHFTPVAKNNRVTLKSKWPHPQFGGQFLPSPKDRSITSNGFSATWNISALATNAQQQLTRMETARKSGENGAGSSVERVDSFGVAFIEPVNIYSQADRAVKYGLLFVALTFAAFFLFEVLKRLPIHPVQYVLVGLALALFFLLLISLSEHIQFVLAYLIASGACILLIGFYLAHVLRNRMRGFGFGAGLTVLYGVLFGLLQSENNALVMGSILLFAVLSAIMITTRKVDWYQIGKPADAALQG